MKVFVLGHRGMLGHVVLAYFRERGIEVLTTDERFCAEPGNRLIQAVAGSDAEWVINAIGKIKQKTTDSRELFEVNSLLPVQLKSYLKTGVRIIHASTDCVFSGRRGNYRSNDERDAEDVYGLSKVLGEVVAETGRCQVIRTSIIGPERTGASGLLAWFLAQRTAVKGYTDHFWNGVTTLEWAKLAFDIVHGSLRPKEGLIQVASPGAVSKFELLQKIANVWNHNIAITPVETGTIVNRTLVPDVLRPSIQQQLEEMHEWYKTM
jgi:dTDP-4-dehydrorhamnose reductase